MNSSHSSCHNPQHHACPPLHPPPHHHHGGNPRLETLTRRFQSSPTADRKTHHSSPASSSCASSPSNSSLDDSFSPQQHQQPSPSLMMMVGVMAATPRQPHLRLADHSPTHLRSSLRARRRTTPRGGWHEEARRRQLARLSCAAALATALLGAAGLVALARSSVLSPRMQQRGDSSHHRLTTSVSTTARGAASLTTPIGDVAATQFVRDFSSSAPSCATPPSAVEFTLVTQCSEDRLWMMEYHCQRWPGPVSVAVYTDSSDDEVESRLRELGCGSAGHDLSIETIRADRPDSDYPVNELRNAAFRRVRTSHVVYVDIDFWVATNLYDVLQLHLDELRDDPRLALVLPAFALRRQCRMYKECPSRNIPHMPKTKTDVLENLLNRTVTAFDPSNYGGHGSTHYVEWMDQEDDELEDIGCVLSNRYEPYLVVRYCDALPPFQPAFTGYGKNKMTWIMQLRRLGYRLAQLNSFVCHYPHLDSKARLAWEGTVEPGQRAPPRPSDPKLYRELKRGQNDQLFLEFKRWLQSDVPDQTAVGLCEEHLDDDAKLWVDRGRAADSSFAAAAAAASE